MAKDCSEDLLIQKSTAELTFVLRFFYFPYIRKVRYFDTNPTYLLYICTC